MKKEYEEPKAEKVEFDFTNTVSASSGVLKSYGQSVEKKGENGTCTQYNNSSMAACIG